MSASLRARPQAGARFRPSLLALEDRLAPSGVPASWSVRGSGGGGALFSPQFNPTNPNELFISSDMSQLFHSTDAGASWQEVNFRQVQGNHETRVQYTEVPNLVYTIDYTDETPHAERSTDGGLTWQPLASDPTGGGAYYLAVDPSNHNRMVVTDYQNVYFSSNAGQSWSLKYTAQNSGAGVLLGGSFWNGSDIYLGTNDGIVASSNGGTSFAVMAVGGIPAGQAIRSFAGARQGSSVRFLAVTDNTGDIYSSVQGYDNNGGTAVYTLDLGASNWTARPLPSAAWPFFAGMALTDTNTMYVAGGSTNGTPTVYKSSSGGASWTAILNTSGNANVQTGWSGAGGDRDWWYGETAMGFAVSATDPNRVVITDYGFAHATSDGGASWKALTVSPADLNPAGANTPKGKAYHDSGLDNTTSWGVTWADANTLFVSNSDIRGQVSRDGGQTFGFGYTGHTLNSMYRVVAHPGGNLYGATGSVHDLYQSTTLADSRIDGGTGQVLASPDKGTTWQVVHDFGDVVSWVAADPANPNRLYASVVNSTAGGIYVTNNLSAGSGSTWTKLANPPRTEGHPFNISVLNDGTLVVSYSGRRTSAGAFTASSGVFVSTDGGLTWQDRSDPGMRYWTKDVVVDPHDPTQKTWYVGVFSGWGGAPNGLGGLYKTTDRGLTWTKMLGNLDRVTSATFNPNDANELFVTTEVQGLWYSNNIRSANPTFTQVTNYPFRQPERVVFNPYNPNEIWVTSFGGGVMVGTTGNPPAPAPGTIQFGSASYTINEGAGSATVTITRTGGAGGAVSVQFATSNGSAAAGSDYTTASGTITWADGDSSPKTFTVSILNDTAVEPNETLNLSLGAPSGGASLGSPASAVLTIVDNDVPPSPPPIGSIQFSTSTSSVGEGAGQAAVTVQRAGGSFGVVTVSYSTTNGTAVAPGDYAAASGTLTWADGDTSPKTIIVPVVNDSLVEPTESLSLILSAPTGGATLGTIATSVLSITDNDVPPPPPPPVGSVQFASATSSVTEGAVTLVVTVQRSGGSYGAITVNYATSNGTAVAPGDYAVTSGTLIWADGDATPKAFSVPIVDDSLVEPTESFSLTLSAPTGGATLGANTTSVVSIADNDVLPPPPPPPTTGGQPFAVGTDAGKVATVTMYNANGTVRFTATPFGTYTGGVRVATGDVTGDGVADVVVGTNSGGIKTMVKIVDGRTGQVRPGELSAGPWYYGAASVAVGDVTGDGIADVAIGSDGGGPIVRVYRGGDFAKLAEFAAGPKNNYWGRTEVALADLTGDGIADLAVTGLYPNGVRVAGFDGKSLRPNVTPAAVFAAFTLTGRGFEGAPNLAAGDVNGDGFADLILASGAWSTTRVLVLSGKQLVQSNARQTLADVAPAGSAYGFGVRVAARDADGDGRADILTGAGTGRGSKVRVYLGKSLTPVGSPAAALDFDAYLGFAGGVFVG